MQQDVIDPPFTDSEPRRRPIVSPVDAQPILYTLLDVLRHPSVQPFIRAQDKDPRSMTKGQRRRARRSKEQEQEQAQVQKMELDTEAGPSRPPPLVYGINSVTRRLEKMIADKAAAAASNDDLDVVLVCRADLDPPKLAAHFPLLACSVNAVCYPSEGGKRSLRVIPLPEGAELLLADALGVRRCGALALSTERLPVESLTARIDEANVQPLRASWLDAAAHCALATHRQLRASIVSAPAPAPAPAPARPPPPPTFTARPNVVTTSTTAPTNLNAVKLAKKHTRTEKKEWRKAKRKEGHAVLVAATKRSRRQRRAQRAAKGRVAASKATKSSKSADTK